jgi:hypothetical protein
MVLLETGSYMVEENGVLARYSMSYEQELRPLEAA